MPILCVGAAGYVGSHTAIRLAEQGYDVAILDNLSHSSKLVVDRVGEILGKPVPFLEVDIRDRDALRKAFDDIRPSAVIHFAAFKAVGESVKAPLRYYQNNICGTLTLLQVMHEVGCKKLVFSGSATVYCSSQEPLVEEGRLGPCCPYGQTKFMTEQIFGDLQIADPTWQISILRYFNPIGTHKSGLIGESPDEPLNLMPYIQQVAIGRREHLNVFGGDWKTPDGSGVRDYTHIDDIADGHVAALAKLKKDGRGCLMVHNLGTGKGTSVLEMCKLFEEATGKNIPTRIVDRRAGDHGSVVACVDKAKEELKWEATRTIIDACASSYNFQSKNPRGFEE